MTMYTAQVARSEGWWAVTVPEVPGLFTQVRTLAEVEAMVRDALTLFPEAEDNPAAAEVRIAPLDDAGQAAVRAKRDNDAADKAKVLAARDMAAAAQRLIKEGITYRDAGMLLGVSHQRVQQLVKGAVQQTRTRPVART